LLLETEVIEVSDPDNKPDKISKPITIKTEIKTYENVMINWFERSMQLNGFEHVFI